MALAGCSFEQFPSSRIPRYRKMSVMRLETDLAAPLIILDDQTVTPIVSTSCVGLETELVSTPSILHQFELALFSSLQIILLTATSCLSAVLFDKKRIPQVQKVNHGASCLIQFGDSHQFEVCLSFQSASTCTSAQKLFFRQRKRHPFDQPILKVTARSTANPGHLGVPVDSDKDKSVLGRLMDISRLTLSSACHCGYHRSRLFLL
ncbi:hypothetical protein RRG08_028015 [Elysia crispata]|uniref:Uncharacterized protein n=1 Tax=Elysia crispata TaxID=231223 RepID=A0AAE1BB37_9GAST|nr:hypothetical protein RRG08_028015 [Elysia crispata]